MYVHELTGTRRRILAGMSGGRLDETGVALTSTTAC